MASPSLPDVADVPSLPWGEFTQRLVWNQGEHIALIGTTGSGKTTLALEVLPKRRRVIAFVTKPKDATFAGLTRKGWRRVQSWDEITIHDDRVLLWPKWRGMADVSTQRRAFAEAIGELFAEGEWCVYLDEGQYFDRQLKMGAPLRMLYTQGRSLGISVVGGTQRPAWVPREMYSESTHVFWWTIPDGRDRRTIGGIGQADPAFVSAVVQRLARHEVLYLNTRSGHMARTMVERG